MKTSKMPKKPSRSVNPIVYLDIKIGREDGEHDEKSDN